MATFQAFEWVRYPRDEIDLGVELTFYRSYRDALARQQTDRLRRRERTTRVFVGRLHLRYPDCNLVTAGAIWVCSMRPVQTCGGAAR